MAGRRRARRFAIQLLYSVDCKEEAMRSNLKSISAVGGRLEGTKLRQPLFEHEVSFANWLKAEERNITTRNDKLDEHLLFFRSQLLFNSIYDLWDAQLAINDTLDFRSLLSDREQLKKFDQEVFRNVQSEDALQLATKYELLNFYELILTEAKKLILIEEDDKPGIMFYRIMAFWVVSELQRHKLQQIEEHISKFAELFVLSYQNEINAVFVRELIALILEYDEKVIEVGIRGIAEENKWLQSSTSDAFIELEKESSLNFNNRPAEPEEIEFTDFLVQGVLEHFDEINKLIKEASASWSISRMAMIDRTILRLATFELSKCKDIPPLVSIDEAIRNAQFFSEIGRDKRIIGEIDKGKRWRGRTKEFNNLGRTHDSPKFVNGVLDFIARKVRPKDIKKRKN